MELDIAGDHVQTMFTNFSRPQQSKRGLQVLLTLVDDSSLLFQLSTPGTFTTLTSVCRRLRILTKTHLNLWFRSRFSDIKKVYADRINEEKSIEIFIDHPDKALSKQMIIKCLELGNSEVLHLLLQNLPMLCVLYYGTCMEGLFETAVGCLNLMRKKSPYEALHGTKERYDVTKVLFQVYNDQKKHLESFIHGKVPMEEIRDTALAAAVRLEDLEMVKMIWPFAYDPAEYRNKKMKIHSKLIEGAIERNRPEIVRFFVASAKLCWWDYDDKDVDIPALRTVLYFLNDIGVNNSNSSVIVELYLALGGDMTVFPKTINYKPLYRRGLLDLVEFSKAILGVKIKPPESAYTVWTMETVVARAVFQNNLRVLQFLLYTGININEIGGSHGLIIALDFPSINPSTWDFKFRPHPQGPPSVIRKCLINSHYAVLTRLVDRHHHVTPTMLGNYLLDMMDKCISKSKATISENCIVECLDWLSESKNLEKIETTGFLESMMNKALQAAFNALFQQIFKLIRATGVTRINFAGVERKYALGGNIFLSVSTLIEMSKLPILKELMEIFVLSGFHVGCAQDDWVKKMNCMLVEGQGELVDCLWNLGALDSFVFGGTVIALIEVNENEMIEEGKVRGDEIEPLNDQRFWYLSDLGKSVFSLNEEKSANFGLARRKLILDMLYSASGIVYWTWDMQTIIMSA
ncbi:hypothetical protein HDU76_004231, partial [Blyttiomyces sp. JEL0837]